MPFLAESGRSAWGVNGMRNLPYDPRLLSNSRCCYAAVMRHVLALSLLFTGSAALAHPALRPATELVDFYSPQRQDMLLGDRLPLVANYSGRAGDLAFAAVAHSSDPKSPTFRMITGTFKKMRPTTVILEGFPTTWGPNPARIINKVASGALASSYDVGEDMYAARLAATTGAVVWGAEPDDAEIAARLKKAGFSARDIFFASMFGPLAQDREAKIFVEPHGSAFEKSYRQWATVNARNYDHTAPLDPGAFRSWFEQHYGRTLEQDPDWSDRGGPGQAGIAGKIGRASNRIRDQHMFALAARLAGSGQRVLLVAGGSHLSSQWRALKATFGVPTIRSRW